MPAEHSHVGGEGRVNVRRDTIDNGPPASAGRTPTSTPSPGPSPEHPRFGGEDLEPHEIGRAMSGTPPRRRGGHFSSWTNRRRCTRSHEHDYNRHGYRPLDHREPHERLTRRLIGRAQARPLDHSWKGSTLACSRCLTSRRRSNSSTQARLAAALRWARSGRPTRGLFAFVSFGPL